LFEAISGGPNVQREPAMKKVFWAAFSVLVVTACASFNASPTPIPTSTGVTGPRKEVITMQVTVQVSADVARALHQRGPPTAKSKALLRMIETFGLTLEPMHRDTDDPNLRSYFIVEVPDNATAQRVIDRLRRSEAVAAVYVKPPDALP
jgi:hypothetical protein